MKRERGEEVEKEETTYLKITHFGKIINFAKISMSNYNELSKYSWGISPKGYVFGSVKGRTVLLHCYIFKKY